MAFLDFFERDKVESYGPAGPAKSVTFPPGYAKSVSWLPQLGDIFPNFTADSTQGRISFHDWAEGHWVLIFSHPSTASGVSVTEYIGLANLKHEFAERGVKILGFCCDPAVDHARWEARLGAQFNIEIDFPTIDDSDADLSKSFGMVHPKQGQDFAIRKSFIIDPALRLKMAHDYPINVGRSIDETLRSIDALQLTDDHRLGIPADWNNGDDCLIAPYVDDAEAIANYGEMKRLDPVVRIVPCPAEKPPMDMTPSPPQTVKDIYHQR